MKGMILRVFLATSHAAMFSSTSTNIGARGEGLGGLGGLRSLQLLPPQSIVHWGARGEESAGRRRRIREKSEKSEEKT